ncbi:MAG: DNA/RNA nuclease SfsA [Bacillota bacterium]
MDLGSLVEGALLERLNRFLARVQVREEMVLAHVPNSGRLTELMLPGTAVLVRPAARTGRRTGYDLVLVDHGGGWTCVDTRLPPGLLAEAIAAGRTQEFPANSAVRREVRLGKSRVDLRVSYGEVCCYVETKSVTLVEAGQALFPDAPTARGTRHLAELEKSVEAGHRAVVAFVVQRPDAVVFSPNVATDPEFSQGLLKAKERGVEVACYRCFTAPDQIRIEGALPIRME